MDDFAVKQLLERKRSAIQLVLEELLENILFPRAEKSPVGARYFEETKETEIRAVWNGDGRNPLEDDDERGQLSG